MGWIRDLWAQWDGLGLGMEVDWFWAQWDGLGLGSLGTEGWVGIGIFEHSGMGWDLRARWDGFGLGWIGDLWARWDGLGMD